MTTAFFDRTICPPAYTSCTRYEGRVGDQQTATSQDHTRSVRNRREHMTQGDQVERGPWVCGRESCLPWSNTNLSVVLVDPLPSQWTCKDYPQDLDSKHVRHHGVIWSRPRVDHCHQQCLALSAPTMSCPYLLSQVELHFSMFDHEITPPCFHKQLRVSDLEWKWRSSILREIERFKIDQTLSTKFTTSYFENYHNWTNSSCISEPVPMTWEIQNMINRLFFNIDYQRFHRLRDTLDHLLPCLYCKLRINLLQFSCNCSRRPSSFVWYALIICSRTDQLNINLKETIKRQRITLYEIVIAKNFTN